ncbi:hypothetical protein HID58_008431, partial [Brassica napus]
LPLSFSVSRPRARESLIVFGKMNTGGRLIAGSHNRNEFVLINADESARIRSVEELSGQSCQICGDEIELSDDGESFVACNECAFPVCRTCYEYERREGNQSCPQCKTRYKRIKGSPRVEGDEEDDGIDDLDFEFDYKSGLGGSEQASDTFSRRNSEFDLASAAHGSQIPLLTYGDEVWTLRYLQIDTLLSSLHHLPKSIGIKLISLTRLVSPLLLVLLMFPYWDETNIT